MALILAMEDMYINRLEVVTAALKGGIVTDSLVSPIDKNIKPYKRYKGRRDTTSVPWCVHY